MHNGGKMEQKVEQLIKTNDLNEIYAYVKQNKELIDDLKWESGLNLTQNLLKMLKNKKNDQFKIANAVYMLGFCGMAYQVATASNDPEIIDMMQKLAIESEDSDIIIKFASKISKADKKAMIFYMLRNDMYQELADFALAFPDYKDYIIDIFKEEKQSDYIQFINDEEDYQQKIKSGEIDPDSNIELCIDWDSID